MKFRLLFVLVLIFAIGYSIFQKNNLVANKKTEKNTPKAFLSEVYDKIKENYFEKIEDEKLVEAFKRVSASLGKKLPAEVKTKDELIKNLCAYYRIKPTQIRSPKRDASLVKARQVAMYILRKDFGLRGVN